MKTPFAAIAEPDCLMTHQMWKMIFPVPVERLVTLEGTGILLTHGHAHGVKYGPEGLVGCARKKEAKIALFGHTHVPCNEYHNGIYVLNPGSLAQPRDCSRASYGLIEITPKGILTNTSEFVQYR